MKPAYNDITVATGARTSGLYSIKIAPREWLDGDPVADAVTGIVSDVPLIRGKDFINLYFTDLSYDYGETPKSSKSGDYFEISLGGTINELTPSLQQTIETLRYHEFVGIVMDRNEKMKVIGDTTAGMILQADYKINNASGGNEISAIKLTMQLEERPPYYELPFDSGSGDSGS